MSRISLIIWNNIYDTDQYMILYDYQNPFKDSPTTSQYWRKFIGFQAINPLIRPLPEGTELFNSIHLPRYPFNLITISSLYVNIMDLDEAGTYFIAWTSPFKGKTRLPVEKFMYDAPDIYVENLKYF